MSNSNLIVWSIITWYTIIYRNYFNLFWKVNVKHLMRRCMRWMKIFKMNSSSYQNKILMTLSRDLKCHLIRLNNFGMLWKNPTQKLSMLIKASKMDAKSKQKLWFVWKKPFLFVHFLEKPSNFNLLEKWQTFGLPFAIFRKLLLKMSLFLKKKKKKL